MIFSEEEDEQSISDIVDQHEEIWDGQTPRSLIASSKTKLDLALDAKASDTFFISSSLRSFAASNGGKLPTSSRFSLSFSVRARFRLIVVTFKSSLKLPYYY